MVIHISVFTQLHVSGMAQNKHSHKCLHPRNVATIQRIRHTHSHRHHALQQPVHPQPILSGSTQEWHGKFHLRQQDQTALSQRKHRHSSGLLSTLSNLRSCLHTQLLLHSTHCTRKTKPTTGSGGAITPSTNSLDKTQNSPNWRLRKREPPMGTVHWRKSAAHENPLCSQIHATNAHWRSAHP